MTLMNQSPTIRALIIEGPGDVFVLYGKFEYDLRFAPMRRDFCDDSWTRVRRIAEATLLSEGDLDGVRQWIEARRKNFSDGGHNPNDCEFEFRRISR